MNKKLKQTVFLLIIPVLALGFALAVALLRSGADNGLPLGAEKHRKEWRTLQGNQYVFNGQIDQQLDYDADLGRILAVKLLDSTGRIPVLVPKSIDRNFEVGQRYKFSVRLLNDVLFVGNVEKF
jgi:hypothetical protein